MYFREFIRWASNEGWSRTGTSAQMLEALEVVIAIAERYTPSDMRCSMNAIQEAKEALAMLRTAGSQDAREELETYCQHLQICGSRNPLFNNPCDCGLEAALAAPQPQAGASEPTEAMVLAGAEVLLDACSSEKGNLHPWKPFNIAQVAKKTFLAMIDATPSPTTAGRK